jgi:hypothetical protein
MSWLREINTTITNYIREQEVNVMRERKLLAMLKSAGRISFNWSGLSMTWRVRYRRAPMAGYSDSQVLVFAPRDKWRTATLDWRAYQSTDQITKGERLRNKGKEAIINVFNEMTTTLTEDMTENFCDELYVDGRLAANVQRIHGLESIYGGTDVTTLQGLVVNTGTYAGLSTVPGATGGSWTSGATVWPKGVGDAHYDFWSPIQLNYTHTTAGTPWTDGTTFETNGPQVLRYGIIHSRTRKSKKGQLTCFMLDPELYRTFLANFQAMYRLNATPSPSTSLLVKLGFGDAINFDGTDVTSEYGVPSGVGYGFNVNQMELRSQQGQLFVTDGVEYVQASKSYNLGADFYGNMVQNPRGQVKLRAAGN